MTDHSLRSYLAALEKADELTRIDREVDPEKDMSAIGYEHYLRRGRASLFTNIKGHPGWRAISQMVADRRKWAIALGVPEANVIETLIERASMPLPTRKATLAQVHENVATGADVDLRILPAMKVSEADPGRYIASGMCVVKDPATGIQNVSFHRAQIMGKDRTGFLMLPRQAARILSGYRALGRKMEVAMVIGAHPLIKLAGAFVAPFGIDEMTVAGGLLGSPVETVACRTVDLEVPASAEIVLEGTVDPDETTPEGPFGEVTGTYGHAESSNVFRISAMSFRNDPIFYAIHCGAPPSDTHSIVCATVEMKLFDHLARSAAGLAEIDDLRCPGGVSPLSVAVTVRSNVAGQARSIAISALSSPYLHPKLAVVCDPGISIGRVGELLHALNRRLVDAQQLISIDNTRVFGLDQASPRRHADASRTGSKLVIDISARDAASVAPSIPPMADTIELSTLFPQQLGKVS